MSNKITWLSVIGLVAIVGAGAAAWYFGLLGGEEKRLLARISDRQDLVQIFEKAVAGEKAIQKNSAKAELYLETGLDWKTIAELSGHEDFFKKSLAIYEKGIEKFGSKNILFYLNGGKLAERLGDYDKAERYFVTAIEISPGDDHGYLALLDLYSYKMNKSEEDVLAMLAQGEKTLVSNSSIISARASYLRRIGDYGNALKDYKILVVRFPDNSGYKTIVSELENLLGQ